MARSAKLFVVSGPSGVGKGTLVSLLRDKRPNLGLTVSATTRSPRPGEVDGVAYYFLSDEEFKKRVDAGEFLEWAHVHGHCYGTLKSEVDRLISAGQSVVLEIDVQGGLMVHKQYPNSILVFIKPPSFEELEQRLRGRGTEDEKTISTRLSNASREMEYANDYTVCIVNDNLETALSKLEEVFDDYESDGGQL